MTQETKSQGTKYEYYYFFPLISAMNLNLDGVPVESQRKEYASQKL